jgi:hypothetical protein
MSEVGFWELAGFDPVALALSLANNTGNAEECERIMRAVKMLGNILRAV